MKPFIPFTSSLKTAQAAAAFVVVVFSANGVTHAAEPVKFVPFHHVEMNDVIWRPRIRMLVRDTLPHAFKNTEVAQERLRLCAEWLESGGKTPKPRPHRFNTSDLYKVMEGAALMIQSEPNQEIEKIMDGIIDIIARAQADDGYPHDYRWPLKGAANNYNSSERGPN